MRKLSLNEAVLTELEKLPPRQYRQVVSAILDLLADPFPINSIEVAGTSYRRLAIGESRVVYTADTELVRLIGAGTRSAA